MKRIYCVLLSLLLLAGCSEYISCPAVNYGTDLMATVQAKDVEKVTDLTGDAPAVTDFGVRLFQQSLDAEKNTLISPLSVLCALAMTANGADGETLAQMENVLGMPVTDLNTYIHSYMSQLPSEKTYRLSLANSIWFTDDGRFTVNQDFLQTNADYYGADMYQLPLDEEAVRAINGWVGDKTEGMIPKVLDTLPRDAIMCLVNALVFEAEWEDDYESDQVRPMRFNMGDDDSIVTDMLLSTEGLYLEDEQATGVIKYYDDKAYAFVALLPNEDVSVTDYVASLTGEHLQEMLANPTEVRVYTAIPKFETGFSVEMNEILADMGMEQAFDGTRADFSRMGQST
ncbi:MAG: serpin family protein, partial [Firmicutes bacterium]|nr:serpin family protein [Bacillota bacterium]